MPVVGWETVDGVEQLGIRAHGEIHKIVDSEKTQNAMGAADGFDRTATPWELILIHALDGLGPAWRDFLDIFSG